MDSVSRAGPGVRVLLCAGQQGPASGTGLTRGNTYSISRLRTLVLPSIHGIFVLKKLDIAVYSGSLCNITMNLLVSFSFNFS